VEASAREAGDAAELAAIRKIAKYSHLSDKYTFYPDAVETLGPFNETPYELVGDICRRIARREFFLFQRLSVVVERFNSILLHERFLVVDHPG